MGGGRWDRGSGCWIFCFEVGVGYSVSRWVLDILFRGMRWKHHAMGKDDAGQKEWDSEP